MRFECKIRAKGQTTIPVEVRKALGAAPGDFFRYQIEGDEVKLLRRRSVLELAGILHDPDRSPLAIEGMNALPAAAVERYDKSDDDRN